MAPIPFPELPLDIIRLIYEALVHDYRPAALGLVLVSRCVQSWIDPLLYRVVQVDDLHQITALARTISTSAKPKSFFSLHVKKLCISLQSGYSDADLETIVSACDGVSSFAARGFYKSRQFASHVLNVQSNNTHLTRFSFDPTWADNIDFSLGLFRGVTHLEIDLDTQMTAVQRSQLRELPNLTHLSVRLDEPQIFIPQLAPFIPPQTAILMVWVDELHSMTALGKYDSRFVFATGSAFLWSAVSEEIRDVFIYRSLTDWGKDWGFLPNGEQDIWEIAAEVQVEQKRLPSL
ncbi:hypothetical protein C8J56DRAFT_126404 [Mycena floridula]|nr:hypothetical protein C8J56DRAFT_126404 [Mycena floridula]